MDHVKTTHENAPLCVSTQCDNNLDGENQTGPRGLTGDIDDRVLAWFQRSLADPGGL